MTVSEFMFLAIGLGLGVASGAALIEIIRARPSAHREIRLTVAQDAIPRRRATTLADDGFVTISPEPARGGPADRRGLDGPVPVGATDRRTNVRSRTVTILPSRRSESTRSRRRAWVRPRSPSVTDAKPPWREADRIRGRTRAQGDRGHRPDGGRRARSAAVDPACRPPGAKAGPAATATERCAEERRVAGERCELAIVARARAEAAADALRTAQRTYDGHEAAALSASWRADPRAVHEAKDGAQGGFRAAVAAAKTPEQLEAAARDWLTEINRINTEAREATVVAAREHAAATAIGNTLERLGLEADAARIGAETADAVCLAARVALADCDQQAEIDPESFLITPLATAQSGMPRLDDDETLGLALEAGGAPRIFRLLRGDRTAMTSLVAALAGGDVEARRSWQLQLTSLVEAIVADAIEASALEFPDGHAFWSVFTRAQDRDIAAALSSLGYRFDGLGSWTDGRHPSQRNLSLALGYAGLDPKRVRHWPTEDDIAGLFDDVTVAADEYLATIAGDLTLAEMVTMLGRRADGLAEIWNHWGQLRPLLLDEG